MRSNLYMFRHSKRLTQTEMAKKIGCDRSTYLAIELGTRNGRETFWNNLQKAFNVPDADMVGLKQKDD